MVASNPGDGQATSAGAPTSRPLMTGVLGAFAADCQGLRWGSPEAAMGVVHEEGPRPCFLAQEGAKGFSFALLNEGRGLY